jgi:hypothetical protein
MLRGSYYKWTIAERQANGGRIYAWVVTDLSGRRMTAGTEQTRAAAALAAARSAKNLEQAKKPLGERA